MRRLLGLAAGMLLAATPAAATEDCRPGLWFDPANRTSQRHEAVMARAATHEVVLLGEIHDRAEHHRWQLSVLAGLLTLRGELVIGFETFPARVQPALDRWVRGELGEAEFLAAVEWDQVWGVDPELYLPLFRFARLHRLPMQALSVERALVARVGREGWAAIPRSEREQVGDPTPPAPAYIEDLRTVAGQHAAGHEPSVDDAFLQRFVEAQLVWDRAMAQALAARRRGGATLVVGLIGSEHLRHRHGVPYQLAAMGIGHTAVLLPHDVGSGCDALAAGEADAVFVLADRTEAEPRRPRLGVSLATADGTVSAVGVATGSIAEAAGLRLGDVILEAAGKPIADQQGLIGLVRGMAPGTWLPLVLRRDGRRIEAVAKFPPLPRLDP